MANMSYCRFQNTLNDLRDCQDAMGDNDFSEEEVTARRRLLVVCAEIVDDYGYELEDDLED